MLLKKSMSVLTSLRLTVVCLTLGIALVFFGTVAQVTEGLYDAQNRWFRSFFIWWGPAGADWKIPFFPGGYLVGVVLLVNLLAAHIKRFQLTWKKLGIHVTHAGVILLLIGQLATDLLSRETQMRFAEGETRNYSESGLEYELAFISEADADTEEIVSIPQALLVQSGELKHEKLPFTVRVKNYWRNSDPSFRAPMAANTPPLTTNGVARHFDFKQAEETHKMDSKNVPSAVIEIATAEGSLGLWVVSGWAGDEVMASAVRRSFERQLGHDMADTMASRLTEPQVVEAGGRKFRFTLRPTRAYKPFSMTLLQTTHTVYRGTISASNPDGIPKDFRSRVRIANQRTGENREAEIYMNSPLRYGGLTFYQYQMGRDELDQNRGSSTLQVVRNPGWLTPYVGCILVGGGLLIQFLLHLVGFIKKRRIA
jgi:hypothetical protein